MCDKVFNLLLVFCSKHKLGNPSRVGELDFVHQIEPNKKKRKEKSKSTLSKHGVFFGIFSVNLNELSLL